MENTIEKLHKLNKAVHKLEAALQDVWSQIDDIGEDEAFRDLKKKAKQYKAKKQSSGEKLDDLLQKLDEFDNSVEQIPEDGTAAVDLEDAISELIQWMEEHS